MDNLAQTQSGNSVEGIVRLYEQAKKLKEPMIPEYRMAAAYCLPRQFNAWGSDGPAQTNDSAARRYQYDSTGAKSLPKYVSILNALLTPQGSRWHKIAADNPQLMKIHSVRAYFDSLNNSLFKYRYDPDARFVQSIGETYTGLGVYGMGPLSLVYGAGMNGRKTFKYKAWPMRDMFVLVNDEGEVTHVFRRFWLNARQCKMKFKNVKMPRSVAAELQKPTPDESNVFELLHCLYYRDNYTKGAIDLRRHRVVSHYVCVKDKEMIGDEEGYSSMPIIPSRVYTEAGNPYGYSPAMMAAAALGAASQTKKTLMKQGHKAVDPPLLASDDGVLSGRVDIRPGRTTYGAVNSQGQPLVHALQSGSNFQVGRDILQDERDDIEDSFFVKLFTILEEKPQMSIPQVIDEIGQKASLLAPTMGRLQSELGSPMVAREIDLMTEHGLREDMPPELLEAAGEYSITYTSPMAKALYNEDIAGAMRWIEFSLTWAEKTQDPSVLDRVDIETMQPEIADYMNVPTRWVASNDKVAEKAAKREQRMQQQQVADQAPALASVVNTVMKQKGTSNAPGVSNG